MASGVHASNYFPSEFPSTCFSNISLILTSTLLTSLCCPHDSYPCVDIVAMGRGNSSQPSSTQFIAVDLAHPSQVAAAASVLAGQWYSGSKSSSSQSLPSGVDIVINNAGVFTGAPPGLIWATNSHAPILISRAITQVLYYSARFTTVTLFLFHLAGMDRGRSATQCKSAFSTRCPGWQPVGEEFPPRKEQCSSNRAAGTLRRLEQRPSVLWPSVFRQQTRPSAVHCAHVCSSLRSVADVEHAIAFLRAAQSSSIFCFFIRSECFPNVDVINCDCELFN